MSSLLAFQGYQQVITTPEFRSQLESLSVNDFKKNIYFWLHWVFVAALAFLQLRCMGFLLWWLLLLQSTGFRANRLQQLQHIGSVVVALRLQSTGSIFVAYRVSCSEACGIFLLQGSNPRFLLAGRFFTTEQPGKPLMFLCVLQISMYIVYVIALNNYLLEQLH